MNGYAIASAVLELIGVVMAAAGSLGVLVLREPLARLHPAALASAVAPIAIGAALALHGGFSVGTAKALLAVFVIIAGSAALTYSAASATLRWRERQTDR